jgi:hypothetical protein
VHIFFTLFSHPEKTNTEQETGRWNHPFRYGNPPSVILEDMKYIVDSFGLTTLANLWTSAVRLSGATKPVHGVGQASAPYNSLCDAHIFKNDLYFVTLGFF